MNTGQSCTDSLERQLIGRALESILVATSNALEEEMGYTRNLVRDLLADLEDDINRDNLKRLLHYSRRMAGFQSRARYVKRAVDEVLESGTSDFTYGGKT
jgi:magnesium transporter